jgi:hypothetical protein
LHAGREQVAPVEQRVIDAFTSKEIDKLDALLHRLIAAVDD